MEYIKPFLIGGSVIAGSKFVAKYSSPALAPIVGGMPTGIIASFFLENNQDKKKFYDGYFYTAILLGLAIVVIDTILNYDKNMNVNLISILGILLWAVASYVTINHFVKKKK